MANTPYLSLDMLINFGHIIPLTSKHWSQFPSQYCDLNLSALRKTKIVYNFGLSECNRVKVYRNTTKVWFLFLQGR